MGKGDRRALVSITPGLEEVLLAELGDLGVDGRVAEGGVEIRATPEALLRVHLHSRVAARVTVRLGSSHRVRDLGGLSGLVRSLPWRDYVVPGQEIAVRATLRGSTLRHRDSAERKVSLAITDALRGPRLPGPRPPREPLLVVVRVVGDEVTVSVDASGELLHRRGWRRATAKAPIRENLAAAVLRLAGWRPGTPLVDPMCGSGTFAIEAAQWAAGIAPGARRDFALSRWPSLDQRLYKRLVAEAGRARPLDRSAVVLAADRDPGAVEATRSNARRAGVGQRLSAVHTELAGLDPPASPGLVVVNPPWGRRIQGRDKSAVFAHIGAVMRERWAGWRLAILLPDPKLRAKVDRRLAEVGSFSSGGVRLHVAVGEIGG